MPYYSPGIVDAGTSGSFVYGSGWRSRPNIRITGHGGLDGIYRGTYNGTTLYKPIKGGWYSGPAPEDNGQRTRGRRRRPGHRLTDHTGIAGTQ